ncbi:hypothetical protein GCM10010446_14030 [Streptomyces enissocaesilis]|uniref:Uncharacterized protein n=1 Tax=Streptomyces enissocaesilis TaxID=332589 RepID=A0ABN3WXM7_9ACTN
MLFVGAWHGPLQLTTPPGYARLSGLGIPNTLAGVVVPNICAPLAVLLLRQRIQALPRELLDRAPPGWTAVGRGAAWCTAVASCPELTACVRIRQEHPRPAPAIERFNPARVTAIQGSPRICEAPRSPHPREAST